MNFYKHYIGDFQRDTGHLSLTERGAYLSLMHHYYATEKPLPSSLDALCRIAGAVSKIEREAVKEVTKFFVLVDSGLMHNRIEAELEKAGDVSNTNREIAIAREAKRRATKESRPEHEACTKRDESVTRTEHEQSTNQTPDTINNKTIKTKTQKRAAGADVFPEISNRELVADWLEIRKLKKLATTGTAIAGFVREAGLSGLSLEAVLTICCENGWGGFKAKWLEDIPDSGKKENPFEGCLPCG